MSTKTSAAFLIVLAGSALIAAPAAHADGIVNVEVDGNVLEAEIELLSITVAELRIEFEDVTGLDEDALGLSAELLGPLDLLALVSRLPSSTSIPGAFPVLLSLDPESGLEMQGVVEVSLHTDLLPYSAGTPLRLFAASPSGSFRDVTSETGSGSYRGGGARPEPPPEQFVIAADTRSDTTVGESKLDRLDDVLETRAGLIDSTVLAELEGLAEDVRDAFDEEDYEAAIGHLDDLVDAVVENSGENVPDTFEVGGSDVNVAGELRSEAATLRYTLVRLDEGPY